MVPTTTSTDGVTCTGDLTTGSCRIEHADYLVRDDDDVFVPCEWADNKEIMAYSGKGYTDRSWVLPPDWRDVSSATVSKIGADGLTDDACVEISDGKIQISVSAGTAVSIRAE